MSHRLRPLLLLVTALAALVVVACGESDKATPSSDVNQLLKDTFSNGNPKSGKLHLAVRMDSGVSLTLDGPFESGVSGRMPNFSVKARISAAGRNIDTGATATGDKGFVSLQGQQYAVSDEVFKQFRAAYEQAAKQASANQAKRPAIATLGVDPTKWFKNPKNEGDAKVGDTDTIKMSGDVDVGRMIDDLSKAAAKMRSLGVQGLENLPSQLTPEQRAQALKEFKDVSAEIYTGKDDAMLRRMHVRMGLQNSKTNKTVNIDFDLSYTDVNEGQDIETPSNAKPFDQLLAQLQQFGQQLNGGTSSGGGNSGSGSGGSSSGPSSEDLNKYTDCVAKAGNDSAKAEKCADLLKTP